MTDILQPGAVQSSRTEADRVRRSDLQIGFEFLVFIGVLGLIESFGYLSTTPHHALTIFAIAASSVSLVAGLCGLVRLKLNDRSR